MSYTDEDKADRELRSAASVARRAKQIQDACIAIGCTAVEVIAATIIADRIEDLQVRLDGLLGVVSGDGR